MATIAIYGAGQLGTSVAELLRERASHTVEGPFSREQRGAALASGADVVLIAVTTFFRDVADYIREAVTAGSNVLVSAEECAYPWAVDRTLADELDALARDRGVSIAGCGVNPGLIFDGLVLTLLGAAPWPPPQPGQRPRVGITVRRTVDISKFGATVLRRIGIGATPQEFAARVAGGTIVGHAGFPQSMSVVADALGVHIDGIDRVLQPVLTETPLDLPGRFIVPSGHSAGVDQTYTARVAGEPWFTSHFFGHVDPGGIGRMPRDELTISLGEAVHQTITLNPGIAAQAGSQNMVANSVERIIAAEPGWVTVAQLPPAYPQAALSCQRVS